MRAKRGRSVKTEKVHQRMTSDAPINSVLGVKVVDDPYEMGSKLQVLVSLRDDPLAGMYSRGQIDDAQLAGGRKWQRHYEEAEIGGIRAIDPTKEAVDGGRIPEPITDRQIIAFRELTRADKELGQEGRALIRDILGGRMSVSQAAVRRGLTRQREIDYVGYRFRECLDTLAVLWNFAGRG